VRPTRHRVHRIRNRRRRRRRRRRTNTVCDRRANERVTRVIRW